MSVPLSEHELAIIRLQCTKTHLDMSGPAASRLLADRDYHFHRAENPAPGHPNRAFWVRELDRAESDATALGEGALLLFSAQVNGFTDWANVVHLAREHAHPGAIELLCRRVERAL